LGGLKRRCWTGCKSASKVESDHRYSQFGVGRPDGAYIGPFLRMTTIIEGWLLKLAALA